MSKAARKPRILASIPTPTPEPEAPAARRASIVRYAYKAKYKAAGHPDNCGDAMARALTEATVEVDALGKPHASTALMAEVADDNGISDVFSRWSHLNPGQQRMNLGNVLRGMQKRGKTITVGTEEFPG